MEGFFRLKVTDEGMFLVVNPEGDVTLSDVVALLKERRIEDYDGQAVAKAVQERTGEPVKIADRKPELDRPAEVEIRISEDAMSCSIRVIPPLGPLPLPSVEHLERFLKEHGVVEGIKHEVLEELSRGMHMRQWVEVAKGREAVHGRDAVINYKIDLQRLKPKETGEGSRVDMKDLGTVINVLKGQELAEKLPPVQGADGITLMGKPVKAQVGKDKNLPAGPGTELSEDRTRLYAAQDGHVSIKDGKLCVSPIFEVKGDVDYGVGNIQFVGPVVVHGSVREGFSVKAGGDLFVEGVVEGAFLSSEGAMNLKVGVRGTGKAVLEAKGDIRCPYIDQAKVVSGGDVYVSEAITHSLVSARGAVVVQGSKKGQIVGGRVQAGLEVVCETLGSDMGTRTEVVVGVPPELMEERKRLTEALRDLKVKMAEVDTNLGYLKKMEERNLLDDQKRALMVRLTRAKFQLQGQVSLSEGRLKAIEEEMERSKAVGKVRVKGVCHNGVVVSIRGMNYIVRDDQRFVTFLVEEGEIRIKPFDY
ncbi:MAG: FapA family protein [Thermanaerothrix sp.]|nr:FapA family protein [Thermanaerothrix sp.]